MSLRANFKVHFADLGDPEIAFLGSLALAELCYGELLDPGAWQGGSELGSTEIQAQMSAESPQTLLTLHDFASSGALQVLSGPPKDTRDVAPTFTA